MAAKTEAHVGSDNDEGEQIKSDGADGVVEGLGGRIDGIKQVENAKARIFVEKQNHGMNDGDTERKVSRPVVNPEIIKPVMRPGAVGAVTEGHEQSQEEVQGDGADGGEADVGGKIQAVIPKGSMN